MGGDLAEEGADLGRKPLDFAARLMMTMTGSDSNETCFVEFFMASKRLLNFDMRCGDKAIAIARSTFTDELFLSSVNSCIGGSFQEILAVVTARTLHFLNNLLIIKCSPSFRPPSKPLQSALNFRPMRRRFDISKGYFLDNKSRFWAGAIPHPPASCMHPSPEEASIYDVRRGWGKGVPKKQMKGTKSADDL